MAWSQRWGKAGGNSLGPEDQVSPFSQKELNVIYLLFLKKEVLNTKTESRIERNGCPPWGSQCAEPVNTACDSALPYCSHMSEAIFLTWFFGASLTWMKSELVRQFLRRFREVGWVEREPRSVLQRAVNYVNAIFPLSPLIRRFWSLKQLQRVVNRTLELINRSRRKHSNGGQVTSLLLRTLCDPVDFSPPCFCVQVILQAGVLEGVAVSSSRGSSRPRDQTHAFCIGRRILYHFATWEALMTLVKWNVAPTSSPVFNRRGLFLQPYTLCLPPVSPAGSGRQRGTG